MTKRCLESIIPFVNSSVYDTTLYICDNNSAKDMVKYLESLSSNRVKVFKSDKNVGKAALVNMVYEKTSNCSHFISIDSDMIADEQYNFIDEMVWCIEHFPEFGVLSTFQKQNNQQLMDGLHQKVSREKHSVLFGQYNSVAGGCVVLTKEMWNTIGHYNTYGGVYGFDDGLMMQAVHLRQKLCGVIETVKLIHPFDTDEQYKNWKSQNIAQRKSSGFYD
jgi:hypothetical protein